MKFHRIFFYSTYQNKLKAFLLLVIGITITIIVTIGMISSHENKRRNELQSICSETKTAIEERLRDNAQILYSGSALFDASDSVDRIEWKTFYEKSELSKNFPGVLGLGYVMTIKNNYLQQHIQSIKNEGFPDYMIWPQGERDIYTSVIFIEPFNQRNLRSFGFDMFSDTIRRKAMEISRDSNIAMLSEKVKLVQETDSDLQSGILMYVPVYGKGLPINTIEQRRKAITGWVFCPQRMKDLMDEIVVHWDFNKYESIRVQLYDKNNTLQSGLLYDSRMLDKVNPSNQHTISVSGTIEFNGKKWTLFIIRDEVNTFLEKEILLVFLAGLIISLLLFFLSLLSLNTRLRAQKIAEQLTLDLKESKELFQTLLNSSAEGIYGIDSNGCCTFANQSCIQLLGYSTQEQLLGKNMHELIHHSCNDGKYFDEKDCKIFRAFREGIGTHVDDEVLWKADGTSFPVEYWSYPIILNGKTEGTVVSFFDITERKTAEAIVSGVLKKNELLFNISSDGIHILDKQGNIIEANPAFCKLLGYSQEEIAKLNVIDWDAQWLNSELLATIEELIKNPSIFETRHRRKDGTIIDVEINAVGVNFDEKEYLYASARDITIRKTSEQALKESEERWKYALEGASNGVWDWNIKTNKLFNSQQWKKLLGLENINITDNLEEWSKRVHPSDLPGCLEALKKHIEGQVPFYTNTYRIRCNDNNYKWVLDRGKIMEYDDDRKPVRMIGTITDIGERIKMEEALKESEARASALLRTLPDLMFIQNSDGVFLDYYIPEDKITYLKPEEFIGKNIKDVLPIEIVNEFIPLIKKVVETKQMQIFEYSLSMPDRLCFYEARTTNYEEDKVLSIVRDITDRKEAYELLQQTRTNYETFFNTIDDFLFVLDEQGNIIHTNDTVVNRLGYTADELYGQSVLMVHPPERRAEAGRIVGEMLQGISEFCPVPIITKTGIQIPVETRISQGIWDRKPVIFGVTKDISQIRLSEEKFSKLFYINPSACGLSESNTGRYIEVNNVFCNLFGFKKEEVIGNTASELGIMPQEVREMLMQNLNNEGNLYNVEAELKTKNGETKHVILSSENIYIQDKTYRFAVVHDITERKLAEKALNQTNKKLEAIIWASPDGIGMIGLDGKLTLVSDKLAEMYGYSLEMKEEFIGQPFFNFIDPSSHQMLSENMNNLLSSKRPQGITEYTAIKKDGTRFFIDVNSTVLMDSNGNPENILFIERDITERKQVEETLKSKTSLLEAQNNATLDAILVVDAKQKMLLINHRMIELFEIPDNITNNTDDALLLQFVLGLTKYPDQFLEKVNYLYNHPKFTSRDEFELKNGMILDTYSAPVLGDDGEYYGRIWSFRDITEQKQAEAAINEASMRLSLATLAGGIGVWDYNILTNKLIWDDQMYMIYDIARESPILSYEDWFNLLHPNDKERVMNEINMALKGEKEFDTEFRIILPDKNIHNIRAMSIVQRDGLRKPLHMIGINWDITEQKKVEESLIKAKLEADIANKAKTEFLANMSHEIRTPMNAILGFSEALLNKLESKQDKRMVKSILSSGNLLLSLLNDILDLSKIEAGKLDVFLHPVDLRLVLQEIQLLFNDKVLSKGLELKCLIKPDLPTSLMLDEIRIKQVFFNLVGNAIKFTHKGYIKISLSFLPLDDIKGSLKILVEDTGIGIQESQQEIIFEAFRQQAGQSNREYGGTGLGLAITKRLVENMNGSIKVKSKVGKGSKFEIIFPEVQISPHELAEKEYLEVINNITFENATILVVDDVLSNIETVESQLVSTGLSVISAQNGKRALEILKKYHPSIILLDMRMPGMDGYEVADHIRANPETQDIPLIAFTASVTSSSKIENSGLFNDYLYKPVKRIELINILTRFLKYSAEIQTVESQKTYSSNLNEIPEEIIDQLPDINQILREKFIPEWRKIKDTLVLFKIGAFAEEIRNMASQFNFQFLINYADRLIEDVEMVDFESIKNTLNEFPEIVNKVANLIKK